MSGGRAALNATHGGESQGGRKRLAEICAAAVERGWVLDNNGGNVLRGDSAHNVARGREEHRSTRGAQDDGDGKGGTETQKDK